MSNPIYFTKVENISLRKALVTIARENKYIKCDNEYMEDKINDIDYHVFVTNDAQDRGCGFSRAMLHLEELNEVTFEKMIELISKPIFNPVQVTLNGTYTAEIQESGDVKVGCTTFSSESIKNLLNEWAKVTTK